MEKDYQKWMRVKADINNRELRPIGFHPREIWVANIGENVGHEEDGKGKRFVRPVLIMAAFGQTCFVLPLSTTEKRGRFYYAFDGHTGKISVALLTQAQTVDSARLRRKTGYATEFDFRSICSELAQLLNL